MLSFAFRLPAPWLRQVLATALSGALLSSCASKDPVAVGQQLGSRMCQRHDEAVNLLYHANQQLVAEMKAGAIKTKAQFEARAKVLRREAYRQDSANATLSDATLAELNADFPSTEDRALAAKQIVRVVEHCDSVSNTQEQQRPRLPLYALRAQLAGPDPQQQPGPDGVIPPPPPPFVTMPPDSAPAQ